EKQIAKASKKKSGAQRKKDAKAKGHQPVKQSIAKDGKSSEQGKRILVPKPKKPWSELSCETSTDIVTVAGDTDAWISAEGLLQFRKELDEQLDIEYEVNKRSFIVTGSGLTEGRVWITCGNPESKEFVKRVSTDFSWTSDGTTRKFQAWDWKDVPERPKLINHGLTLWHKGKLNWASFCARLESLNLELDTKSWYWRNRKSVEERGWPTEGGNRFLKIGIDPAMATYLKGRKGILYYKSVPLYLTEIVNRDRREEGGDGREVGARE
ncbi:unnamed protein product, partial [Allacma fusca]